MGRCLKNTLRLAVAASTESEVLSCPNSAGWTSFVATMPQGFGWGASVRKAGGVTNLAFFTPLPPDALKNADGGFSLD